MKSMKSFIIWLYLAILAVAGASVLVHVRSLQEPREHLARLQPLYERMPIYPEMRLSMEKYRRASGTFHKMYNAQIAESKTKLREEMSSALSRLAHLDSTEMDRGEMQAIQDKLNELLSLSAKYEPQLFLKDAYAKPDVQDAHNEILKGIDDLEQGTQQRLQHELTDSSRNGDRSTRLMMAAQVAILMLVLSMIVRMYLAQLRPIRRLESYAEEVAANQGKPEIPRMIPAAHQRIAEILTNLAFQAEQLREQRRKFIEDVIDDLKPGLSALKRSTDVEEASALLSSSLEDLKQLAEISRMEQKLSPSVVDLSELLNDVCKRAARAGLCPEVRVSVPELPTWVRMDAARMERAMTQILAKVGETLEKGQSVEAILQVKGKPGLQGLEVSFHSSGQKIAGAPDQEIGKHWISQKGLALTLAQKIARAHDGAIFASGLIGSPIQITMRFPKTLLTDGLVSPQSIAHSQQGLSVSQSLGRTLEPENYNV